MRTSQIINYYNAGQLSKQEADRELKAVCTHDDLEYEFIYDGEPSPIFTGAHCLDCELDIPYTAFTQEERYEIERDEVENIMSSRIDSAIGYEQDMNAGLL